MPRILKALALVVAAAGASPLSAQPFPPGPTAPPRQADTAAAAYAGSGAGQASRVPAGVPSLQPRDILPAAFPPPAGGECPVASEAPGPPTGKASAPIPLSPAPREAPLPLAPPGAKDHSDAAKRPNGVSAVVTVAGSLAVVLGLFLIVAWGLRRTTPRGLTPLPGQVFELLGRAPLAGRQQVHLLRCGNKLLLVSVTPSGAETLTEITDPVEVDRLAGLCQQARPNSATAAFRQVLQHFAKQHTGAKASDLLECGDSSPLSAPLEKMTTRSSGERW